MEISARDVDSAESASNVLCSSPRPLCADTSTPSRQWIHRALGPAFRPRAPRHNLSILLSFSSDAALITLTYNGWEEGPKSRVCRLRGAQPWTVQDVVWLSCTISLVQVLT